MGSVREGGGSLNPPLPLTRQLPASRVKIGEPVSLHPEQVSRDLYRSDLVGLSRKIGVHQWDQCERRGSTQLVKCLTNLLGALVAMGDVE